MDRRDALRGIGLGTLAAAGGTHGFATEKDAEEVRGRVNTRSEPSQLRITDLRVVNAHNHWIVRLDTNQGLHGYGEVRDGASPTYALMLKSRVLGENPLHVDKVFRKLKQFGFHGRQAGGAVSIEMACWDLAGKAWGVPCWQMLGGKFRDKIRVYADTPGVPRPRRDGEAPQGPHGAGLHVPQDGREHQPAEGRRGRPHVPQGPGHRPVRPVLAEASSPSSPTRSPASASPTRA